MQGFKCKMCLENKLKTSEKVIGEGMKLEIVKQFCYLGV